MTDDPAAPAAAREPSSGEIMHRMLDEIHDTLADSDDDGDLVCNSVMLAHKKRGELDDLRAERDAAIETLDPNRTYRGEAHWTLQQAAENAWHEMNDMHRVAKERIDKLETQLAAARAAIEEAIGHEADCSRLYRLGFIAQGAMLTVNAAEYSDARREALAIERKLRAALGDGARAEGEGE